jgi:hypothetical protein
MNVTLTSTGLSPEEVSKHIEEGRFEDAVPLEPRGAGEAGGSAQVAEIPLTDRPGQSGYLLVNQGIGSSSLPGSHPHPTLSLSLFTCRFGDCDQASELAATLLGGASGARSIALPEGASVSEVRYGDANEDGLTDLLVVLSTGGGILYEQSPGERAAPPPPRPEAPRPAPRPSGR